MAHNEAVLYFPIAYLGDILGERGKTREKIQDDTCCMLPITTRRSGSACCTIKGPQEGTRLALSKIYELINDSKNRSVANENFQLVFTIPQKYGGLLMGKDGTNHKAIQTYFGIKMFLNPVNSDKNLSQVSINGPLNRLLITQQGVDNLMHAAIRSGGKPVNAQMEMFRPYRIMVSEAAIQILNGKGGSNQKKMEAKYDVKIGFKNDEKQQCQIPVEISKGTLEKYENVAKEIMLIARNANNGSLGDHVKMEVPIEVVGKIKGKSGATINTICAKTDTRAYFEETNNSIQMKTLIIEGNPLQTAKAVKEFKKLIDKSSKKKHSALPIQVQEIAQTKRFILPRDCRDQLKNNYTNIAAKYHVTVSYEDAPEDNIYVVVSGPQRQQFQAIQEMLIVAIKSDLIYQEEEGTTAFSVPSDRIGLVLNAKKTIEMKTGVEIDFDIKSNTFFIHGTSFQVHNAKHEILLKAKLIEAGTPLTAFNPPTPPTFECSVCFNNFKLKEGVACFNFNNDDNEKDEKHSFCITCIEILAKGSAGIHEETKLAEGGIGLPCMETECKQALLLKEETLNKLEERCMQESIRAANINGLVRCYNCTYMLIVESGDRFTCPVCQRIQCRTCTRIYDANHFGKTCEQMNLEEIERKRQAEIELQRKAFEAEQAVKRAEEAEKARLRAEAEEARRLEQNLRNNRLSEEFVKTYIKCPSCNRSVEKNGGCNHMTCKCGIQFCYLCGKPWATIHECRRT